MFFLKNENTNKFNCDNYFISDTIFWQNEIESIGIIYATIQIKNLKSYKDIQDEYKNKYFNIRGYIIVLSEHALKKNDKNAMLEVNTH